MVYNEIGSCDIHKNYGGSTMKRIIICIVLLIPLLLLNIYMINERIKSEPTKPMDHIWEVTEDITIQLAQAEYPPNVEKMTVTLVNNSDSFVYYGIGYYFEKYTDGDWVRLEMKGNYAFTLELYPLPRHDEKTIIVTTDILKHDLDAGRYRLTGGSLILVTDQYAVEDGANYPAYVLEFEVSPDAKDEPEFRQ